MKKLMAVAAAALTASVFADGVQSDIVGYSTLTVNKGYTIMALNFKDVSSTDGEMAINTAFPYAEGMTEGNSISTGDNLQVMTDEGGYTTYYMSNGKNVKGTTTIDGLEGKWAKSGAYTPTTDTIASGKAFWYISQGHIKDAAKEAFNITVAGKVMSTTADSRELAAQYMIVGCPYPVDVPLNDGVVVTGATEGNSISTGDNIQIMNDAGGYDTYYLSNGKNVKGTTTIDGLEGKWAKSGAYTPTDAVFPAGGAAWYVRKGSDPVKIQFINPIAQ